MTRTPLTRMLNRMLRLATLTAVVCLAMRAGDQAPTVSEDEARAGFLYQLAQFVQWPGDAMPAGGGPMRFCVMKQDALAATLENIVKGKTIQNRKIVVQNITDLAQVGGCHLAFIGITQERVLRGMFAHWKAPTLLVGQSDHFAEAGGMVNLILKDGRVSFQINLEAAGRSRLELRSQLLRFAQIVTDRGEGTR